MTTLIPTKRGQLSRYEKEELLRDLREMHEETEVEVKYIRGAYRIYLTSEGDDTPGYDGTVVECPECGYKFDELAEGNYVYDLSSCECGARIEDVITK